jgi:hypothetical protein
MNANPRWQQSELSILCNQIEALNHRVQSLQKTMETLTDANNEMARRLGTRLTRAEVVKRLDICNKTFKKMLDQRQFPLPDASGKWLLSEIIEWEIRSGRQ